MTGGPCEACSVVTNGVPVVLSGVLGTMSGNVAPLSLPEGSAVSAVRVAAGAVVVLVLLGIPGVSRRARATVGGMTKTDGLDLEVLAASMQQFGRAFVATCANLEVLAASMQQFGRAFVATCANLEVVGVVGELVLEQVNRMSRTRFGHVPELCTAEEYAAPFPHLTGDVE